MKAVRMLAILVVLGMVLLTSPAASFADDGATLYKSKCAMCHGPDGKGETAMGKKLGLKDLASAEVQKATDAEINDTISKGKSKMPASKSLTPDQVKDLVGFVRSLGKKK